MRIDKPFRVIESELLLWPSGIEIPHGRFRLFVAADVSHISTEMISEFALSALKSGMVYFCAWGKGCEQLHDIVDDVIVEDELGQKLFVGPNSSDVIMSTWHNHESLDEALDYFINCTEPNGGFEPNSEYWVAVCLKNHEWAVEIQRRLQGTDFRARLDTYLRHSDATDSDSR